MWKEVLQEAHFEKLCRKTRENYSGSFREVIDHFVPPS